MPSEQYVASYHPLTFYIHSDAATTVSMDATESPSMVFATAVVAAFDAVGAMVGGVTGAFVGTSNSDSGQSSMVYSELKSRSQIEPEIMQFPLVTLTVQPPAEVENKEQQLPSEFMTVDDVLAANVGVFAVREVSLSLGLRCLRRGGKDDDGRHNHQRDGEPMSGDASCGAGGFCRLHFSADILFFLAFALVRASNPTSRFP
eukprot:CAMPEP_0119569578 /NCGR_PEP_ID=MMETSP1352-20130426/42113_1 /TAXON_ID=265584 /ORGANISM="Stauroneis constricta, Strain CCMP1120" /LENGTH=201 /DNA_ID=CAMNT_0007619157 /DNA_START=457 /DNA_END=1061 /DNA_ORIENTATION=-